MPQAMQAKLLRVLEEQEVERVGSSKPVKVDVRVIVATHRNLEEQVAAGAFRRDLYHRVVVFPLNLPPLRERREDLPALVGHFAGQVCAQNGWKPVAFAPAAVDALAKYAWPGNLRELRNVVERLLLLAEETVEEADVALALPSTKIAPQAAPDGHGTGTLGQRVLGFERATVLAELERCRGHITNTARALGLERSHLYKKCQQLGIDLNEKGQGKRGQPDVRE
jgi:DNA-binding NtrC family response regulator